MVKLRITDHIEDVSEVIDSENLAEYLDSIIDLNDYVDHIDRAEMAHALNGLIEHYADPRGLDSAFGLTVEVL